eukprot:4183866-Prymnesium_polylepis.1
MPPPCAGVYMKCTSPPSASIASTSRTTSSIASPPLRPPGHHGMLAQLAQCAFHRPQRRLA